jgi:L-threonylcarbamoyladenylate synthase
MATLQAQDPQAIDAAARHLAEGSLLAFPTETVYGLGARADDDAAVAAIFAAKGRPAAHPLIVHAADAGAARHFALDWPGTAQTLAAAFWPGALTLIVRREPSLAAAAAGGQGSIGLRVPAHPVAHALLTAAMRLGVPGVAAPSANRFGRVSATSAAHVCDELGDELGEALWVLDGGDCPGGIESTIVDCSRGAPTLLRPGLLSQARIEQCLGQSLRLADAQSPRAPGTLASHYAPSAKLRLMSAAQIRDGARVLGEGALPLKLAVYSRSSDGVRRPIEHRRMPDSADAVAHELFAVLRAFDAHGAQLIWVEQPPDEPAWAAVRDRLLRASAH